MSTDKEQERYPSMGIRFMLRKNRGVSTTVIQLNPHEAALCEQICLLCLGNSAVKKEFLCGDIKVIYTGYCV